MKGKMDWLKAALLAAGIGFLTVIVGAAAFAWLMNREILALEHLDLCSAASLVMGGIAVGLMAGRGEERWLRTLTGAAGVVLLLLLVNLIGFGGDLRGILPVGALVTGAALAGNLALGSDNRGKRRKYQIKKYRTG